MNYFLAILAGAIQGLSEFLPISSTGHLIVFENIFGISQKEFGLAFDASLHLGTLLAITAFFFKEYLQIFNFKNRLLLKLIAGTIPAALIGFFLENIIEEKFRQIWIVGLSLILFSFVIIIAEKFSKKTKGEKEINLVDSIIVGFFQSLALIPGISRSGATISGGMLLDLKRKDAASFAFLLSGPIIAGAGAKKFLEVIKQSPSTGDFGFFVIGIISSAIFGYLTIKYFLRYLSTKTLYPFVVYRILLGTILIIASFLN